MDQHTHTTGAPCANRSAAEIQTGRILEELERAKLLAEIGQIPTDAIVMTDGLWDQFANRCKLNAGMGGGPVLLYGGGLSRTIQVFTEPSEHAAHLRALELAHQGRIVTEFIAPVGG